MTFLVNYRVELVTNSSQDRAVHDWANEFRTVWASLLTRQLIELKHIRLVVVIKILGQLIMPLRFFRSDDSSSHSSVLLQDWFPSSNLLLEVRSISPVLRSLSRSVKILPRYFVQNTFAWLDFMKLGKIRYSYNSERNLVHQRVDRSQWQIIEEMTNMKRRLTTNNISLGSFS